MPSMAKKRLFRKNCRKNLLNFFQKTKPTETGGSVFAETIEQVEKTYCELELIKVVD